MKKKLGVTMLLAAITCVGNIAYARRAEARECPWIYCDEGGEGGEEICPQYGYDCFCFPLAGRPRCITP
jgi:hypothetical protein